MTDPNADRMVGIPTSERTRCETWSRVMGYYRPTSAWNVGKQAEYAERVPFAPRDELTLPMGGT